MKYFKLFIAVTLILALTAASCFAELPAQAEATFNNLKQQDYMKPYFAQKLEFKANITREEFADLLVRVYANSKGVLYGSIPYKTQFEDAKNPMAGRAVNLGFMGGTPNKKFEPESPITQEELAVMLANLLARLNVNTGTDYKLTFKDKDAIQKWAQKSVALACKEGYWGSTENNMFRPKLPVSRLQALLTLDRMVSKYGWNKSKKPSDMVDFADPALEAVIREQINKPGGPILKKDVETITQLNVANRNIYSIDGLEDFKALYKLNMDGNRVRSLHPLAKLQNLSQLYLSNNIVSDLTPLKDNTVLDSLYASYNLIEDISPLRNKSGLSALVLQNNSIKDISVLKDKMYLSYLYIGSNQISDISALKDLVQLRTLFMSQNKIGDISALRNLTELQSIYADYNQISDVSPVANLPKLKDLTLVNNGISNIQPLNSLVSLERLEIGMNQIKDLKPLEGLINLNYLTAYDNAISDLTPLKNMSKLKMLLVDRQQIDNISILPTLQSLEEVRIDTYETKDLEVLKRIPKLRALEILRTYTHDEKLDFKMYETMLLKIDDIIKKNIKPNMTEYQKVKAINHYISNNVKYGYDPAIPVNTYGTLVMNLATCGGYTEATKILLDRIGVESINVYGNMSFYHAWNMVKVDGDYYHLDTTWNVGNEFGYFLLSDDELAADKQHKWNRSEYPACTSRKY